VIFPQCEVGPTGCLKASRPNGALEILRLTQKSLSRILIASISTGSRWGERKLALAAKYPDLFAAIVPIASHHELGDPSEVGGCPSADLGFLRRSRRRKTVTFSRTMHAALRKAGGDARYTELSGVDHISGTRLMPRTIVHMAP